MSRKKNDSLVRVDRSARRTVGGALTSVRRPVPGGGKPEAVFVRVFPRGERRRDFLRRHRFRGVDELRRQQQRDLTPPPEPGSLDKLM